VRFCIELFSTQEVARLNHLLIFFPFDLEKALLLQREIIVTHGGGFFLRIECALYLGAHLRAAWGKSGRTNKGAAMSYDRAGDAIRIPIVVN